MKDFIYIIFVLCLSGNVYSQQGLEQKQAALDALQTKEKELVAEIEVLKLASYIEAMKITGYPVSQKTLQTIEHAGLVLGFDCDYKMASWVYHVLSPDVSFGSVVRTNDFRKDSQISCGSSIQEDYFLEKEMPDGTTNYDGFGFDRGHLAPSADFRWSAKALSESYFYSNMTPQRPEFNRESWAELEMLLRRIVDNEQKKFYVITGPVLNDGLAVIEKSIHKIRIPDLHYKILVDLSGETPRGMAFLMPNRKCELRLSSYVVSIDSIERLTGLNFMPNLDSISEIKIEGKSDFSLWDTQAKDGDVEPFNSLELPKGYYNTQQSLLHVGDKISVVGKVVSTKFLPKSGATFLNLDQSFPNQVFSITIWKDGRRNFSYKPEVDLDGKYIVVTGRVTLDKNGIPGINVEHERQISLWE